MRFLVAIGVALVLAMPGMAQDLSCTAKYCKAMASCQEAVWRLDHCGDGKLDRDNDGLPCENVCKTDDAVRRAREANAAARPEVPASEPDTNTEEGN